MKPTLEDGRHLSREGLEQYLGVGGPATVKIDGAPAAYLVVEPATRKLSLITLLAKNRLPDLSAYQNLTAAVVQWEDDFARATTAFLDAFREVPTASGAPREERKIGMLGELLVLEHILNRAPPETAVACWRGPVGEEHDFDVGEGDVEVKTTTAESRRHWVGSLGQLCPSIGRPLWLVSIQLTGAGMGGTSLAELVARIETSLTDRAIDAFRNKLVAVGWLDQHALDARRLRLPCAPEIYSIDEAFLAITSRNIEYFGLGADKIVQLTYVLDLSSVSIAEKAPKLIKDISAEASP